MGSLQEIQTAIGRLSPQDREALLAWIIEQDRQAWDEEIECDFSPGGAGMKWLGEVDEQIRSGNFHPLE